MSRSLRYATVGIIAAAAVVTGPTLVTIVSFLAIAHETHTIV